MALHCSGLMTLNTHSGSYAHAGRDTCVQWGDTHRLDLITSVQIIGTMWFSLNYILYSSSLCVCVWEELPVREKIVSRSVAFQLHERECKVSMFHFLLLGWSITSYANSAGKESFHSCNTCLYWHSQIPLREILHNTCVLSLKCSPCRLALKSLLFAGDSSSSDTRPLKTGFTARKVLKCM